ncbi:hypothetical protein HCTV5_80 [Halovirus HCTV-5]|uniref:hypothetical protein n=1 Tax=Halovirus HCTV-5 TaxID=1273748 RepID=UPI0003348CD8|nr:hypothetical protein M200_gp145 [Halovirus HCTV-5]AGM11689.1 hypothetical protein HCTV5_80 [Halovirus HCTV-5]
MYDLGQQITERAEELEERFEADAVNVSHYEGKVTFQIEWEDDGDTAENLERAKDILENKLPPEHDPDNTDVSAFDDRFTVSIGYDYNDADDAADEGDDTDEEDNETETETDEE